MPMTPREAAAVLGLDLASFTDADVKRAFRKASKDTHPDRGGDPEQFKRVSNARRALDRELAKRSNAYWRGRKPPKSPPPSPEPRPIQVGDWLPILGVRCGGEKVDSKLTAQLVRVGEMMTDHAGQKTKYRLMIRITCQPAVKLPSSVVEIVFEQDGTSPEVMVRDIVDTTAYGDGRVLVFCVDPLRNPVEWEERTHFHGGFEP